MAADEYYSYNSGCGQHPTPYHDHVYGSGRNDAPLPPIPNPSPYDSDAYPYSHQTPSQSYSGSHGRIHEDADPWEGDNAIPMNRHKPKHESAATITPILPPQEADDDFIRDADPRRKRRRRSEPANQGWFKGRITWVVYIMSVIQLIVFIAEFARMGTLTGSPIETHPSFNPMIGPSPYLLINMGARYQPCMHSMPNVQNATEPISWPCPNATSTTGASVTCTLSELCGFNGVPDPVPGGSIQDKPAPNQWWRFIVPIFIHAGIIHIAFNLLLQLTLGRDIELLIGSPRFLLVYLASGIFGFVLGGNFAANGIASCGCSGSLFGILALNLLDLLYTWTQRRKPHWDLLFIVIDVLIAFALGLLPGLDNFSHIGGFLMGLVLGLCILRSPSAFSARRTTSLDQNSYANPSARPAPGNDSFLLFLRSPLGFFQNRRGIWWAWWLVRAAALVGVLVGFIVLLHNFYQVPMKGCGWCRYLSCLPIKVGGTNWCDVGNLDFTPTNGTSAKRDLFGMMDGGMMMMGGLEGLY